MPNNTNNTAGSDCPSTPCSACGKSIDPMDSIDCETVGCPKKSELREILMTGGKRIDAGICPNGCGPLEGTGTKQECPICKVGVHRQNVKEHAPPLAGARVETGVEAQVTHDVADKAASGGCCASSCSFSSILADVVGSIATPQNTKAVAAAAKESGGVVVMRYNHDAQMMRNVYGVEAISLSEIKKGEGKLMFWESGAIYGLAVQLVNVTNEGSSSADC